jgi:hypothetical protein
MGLLAFGVITLAALKESRAQPIEPARHPWPPSITVTGHGEILAQPDYAVLRLGAVAEAKEANAAQNEVNQKIEGALKTLRDLVLPNGNLRTASLTLMPVYDQPEPGLRSRTPGIIGYRAANTIEVETSELGQVGAIIDRAIASGVNELQNLSFELKDELPARSRALRQAVNEATHKAEAMASALGIRLGGVFYAVEQSAQVFQPRFEMARLAVAHATPVEPGLVRVDATVTLHFYIGGRARPFPGPE